MFHGEDSRRIVEACPLNWVLEMEFHGGSLEIGYIMYRYS